jgi:hypothetical protein
MGSVDAIATLITAIFIINDRPCNGRGLLSSWEKCFQASHGCAVHLRLSQTRAWIFRIRVLGSHPIGLSGLDTWYDRLRQPKP